MCSISPTWAVRVAFVIVDDAAGHVVRQQPVIGPDHADDRNIDIGKDVGRRQRRGADAEDGDHDGEHHERVRTPQRGKNDPHCRNLLLALRRALAAVQHGEYGRHEEQRCQRRHGQSADHGTAERGVLLTSLAKREGHRHHADDHRQGRHQHRAKARESGFERRRCRVKAVGQAFASKAHQ